MSRLRVAIQNSIAEIAESRCLNAYGFSLCLVHVFTYLFWFYRRSVLSFGSKGTEDVACWSFFPNCDLAWVHGPWMDALTFFYLIGAIVFATLFLTRKIAAGWWGLFFLQLLKFFFLILSYRMMGAYHYMPFLITFCFLFVPNKVRVIQALLVFIYLGAALLKFNHEWLSGAALLGDPGVYGVLLSVLCAYVVVLESLIVFGLLSVANFWRWFALVQLAIFHLYSYRIVGFFYPCVMLCLLSVFPMSWREGFRFRWKPIYASHVLIVALFWVGQLIPILQNGDPALVGRGRFFSLVMFDANTQCFGQLYLRFQNSGYQIKVDASNLGPRIHCDPLVFWNKARRECANNRDLPGFQDLDLVVTSKRSTDRDFTPLIAATDFCRKNPSYNVLFANDWTL